jgi:hypothetical protein
VCIYSQTTASLLRIELFGREGQRGGTREEGEREEHSGGEEKGGGRQREERRRGGEGGREKRYHTAQGHRVQA